MKRCASKNAGPRKGWIEGSHIDWRRKRVPTKMLGPKGVDLGRSHIGWGGERNIVYKDVKLFPSRRVLRTLMLYLNRFFE